MTEGKIGILIKSLAVSSDAAHKQGRVEANLFNGGRAPSPPSILLLYFHDTDNRIRDRISLRVPPVEPAGSRTVAAVFRLKSTGFFTYTAEIHSEEKKPAEPGRSFQ